MGIKEADLHITRICNSRCGYCYVDPQGELPRRNAAFWCQPAYGATGELMCVIEAIKKIAGAEDLVLVGGNPCLHPNIVQLLLRAKELGLNICVLSNTHVYMDNGRPVAMAEVTPLLDEVDFTLHGASASAHDAFNHATGSYRQATSQIKEFMLYRKSEQSVGIILNMVPQVISNLSAIMSNIIDDLELNPELDFFSIQRIAPSGKAKQSYSQWRIDRAMVEHAFDTFDDIKARFGISTKCCIDAFPWCAVPEKHWHYLEPLRGGCNWGKPGGVLSVLMDGKLQRCALCEQDLGINILNIESPADFDALFQNNPILRAFNERKHLDKKCLSCELLDKCGGGCTVGGGCGGEDPYARFDPFDQTHTICRGHDYLAD
ncbi:radical SAM protein [Candidatus Saccharibacteria bacterium]|nr:radical SAM protein [Candidatus Saccharibacteria bacterium]